MHNPKAVLQKYWGFDEFKPAQESIINLILNKVNVIALLPTGGGKSLCFQLPALLNDGICIVISPLIALMQDQVNALKKKGIKAMHLSAGISSKDLDAALDNCIYGNFKFLYVSPERLQQDIVQQRIKQMNVNLFAIDEAHCISQWGHDFRPMYQQIHVLHELQPNVPWIALSATATPQVIEDIKLYLKLPQVAIEQYSFARSKISFQVIKTEDKQYNLLNALKAYPGAAIIYVNNRKATQELVNYLSQHNITAASYHGGIPQKDKKDRLKNWLNDKVRIMVATNAFGMGIDKPTVRLVVHYHIPSSIEGYFQESGRAGRDGNQSTALLLYNNADFLLVKRQFLSAIPTVEDVKHVYRKIMSYFSVAYGEGEFQTEDFNFYKFCRHYQLNTIKTYQILELLDRNSILRLSRQYAKKASIFIEQSSGSLIQYLQENKHYAHLLKTILRTYGGVFEQPIAINLSIVAQKAGMSEQEAVNQLNDLHQRKQILFEHYVHDASITLLLPREDDHTINPITPHIKRQLTNKQRQVNSMLNYVQRNTICRSVQLLTYFGEKNIQACGKCSVCIGLESQAELIGKENMHIEQTIVNYLGDHAYTSREIAEALPFSSQQILGVLKSLLQEKRIEITNYNTYTLST
ncbi:ATP-dependent DNA helicase RecQ [Gangjinia marincola]|uniref:ATP-dependent DNA helicase RecQ n=1 Tax=Gangjinia marincola TaxID=578463 RepID=A0ABN1MDW9_9FLAO